MPTRRGAGAGAPHSQDDGVVGGFRPHPDQGSRGVVVVDFGSDPDEVSGADVVVVRAEDGDKWGDLVRDRAPNAVVIVIGDSPHEMCEATLFPRARIIGVNDDREVGPLVDAVVYDR